MNKISGIYGIRSISHPERTYIGSAVNMGQRWREHESQFKLGNHRNPKLRRHCDKYGRGDLVFELIIRCDKGDLIKAEQLFIDLHNPWFNICMVAGSSLGLKHSAESKRKIREAWKSRGPVSEETRRRLIDSAKRRAPASAETRKKLSNALKGRVFSEETKAKMRASAKNKPPVSIETREKQSKVRKGSRRSLEAKKRISAANRRTWEKRKAVSELISE